MSAEAQPNAPYIVGTKDADTLRLEPPGDALVPVSADIALMGSSQQVQEFCRRNKLRLKKELEAFLECMSPMHSGIVESVLPPGSSLIGKTIVDIELRKHYGTSLLAIHRHESTIRDDLRSVPLRAGDTLVLHSSWNDLQSMSRDRNFVVVTDFPREELLRPDKLRHAVFFFALAIVLVISTDMRLSMALLTGAVGMMLSGVLTIDEAYQAVSWQTVFLLAGLIPLGMAVEATGTAAWMAQEILGVLGDVPVIGIQAAIAVLATFFTLVMSNVGATVLLVPLAVNIAVGVDADPAVFALTVALATSNSFLIPTHQVNALVMGPGGYRVVDFMRAGGIMTALFLVVMLAMLNLVY